jgi:FkbM family methyltransferase
VQPPPVARLAKFDMNRLRASGYASQYGQDVILDALFTMLGIENGTFVDVGAHDGASGSNTLFFERVRGWTGLCIEPLPDPFAKLEARRTARCLRVAIAEHDGEEDFLAIAGAGEMYSGLPSFHDERHRDRIAHDLARFGGSTNSIRVPTRRLDGLLAEHRIERIDLLSIDVEGAELGVLASIDFDRTRIVALTVENERRGDVIARFLADRSELRRVFWIGVDEIYLDMGALACSLLDRIPLAAASAASNRGRA